jgi:hypothetical protein
MESKAMKIYISGRITGLPFAEVEAKFQQAESLLEDLGLEPVNPLKNGLTKEHHWNRHMVKDIELLLPCDGILMLDNWTESTGAGIEYEIAMRMGKDVWFETNVAHNHEAVLRIQNAIHEITGMKFCEYTTKSRKRDGFFARMIFVHHCHKNNIDPIQYICRDRTMVYHYLNQYHDEMKFNPYFKRMAKRIEDKLNPKTQPHVNA